ncbi:MAG: hypothetical protein ACOY93_02375 [Bacillota bacterium]
MGRTIAVLLLVLGITLTGCGTTPSPDPVVEGYFEALTAGDLEKASQYLAPESRSDLELSYDNDLQEQMLRAYLARVSVVYYEAEIEGDYATVPLELTAPDIEAIAIQVMAEAFKEAFSDLDKPLEDADTATLRLLKNALNDPEVPMITHEGTVGLSLNGGEWKIVHLSVGMGLGE